MKRYIVSVFLIILIVACSPRPEINSTEYKEEIRTDSQANEEVSKVSQDVQNLTKTLDELDKILED